MARLRATVPDKPLHWAFHLSQPSPVKEERASFQACGKSSGTHWSHDSHVEDSLLGKRPFHSSVSKWRVIQPGSPSTRPGLPERRAHCWPTQRSLTAIADNLQFCPPILTPAVPSGCCVFAQVVFPSETSTLHFLLVNPDLMSRPISRNTCSGDLL